MVVGALGGRTELAIIGAGPGGYVAALRGADAGLDVTLIDAGPVGGTCLNVGCIPSKTLIELANLREGALATEALGLSSTHKPDMASIADHLGATSDRLRHGLTSLLRDGGVTVVAGTAHFVRYDRLGVEHDGELAHLEFDNAIIATGSRPVTLPAFPIGGRVIDSTGALALRELPGSMAIIGGGYIGVELGTAFAKLGTRVTIIEATDRLLPHLPVELARVVARGLQNRSVELMTGASADALSPTGLTLDSGASIEADVIVLAVGRTPNSNTCALETVGVSTSVSGHVNVAPNMEAAANIYAIGDLVPGPALAHKASAEAEVAVAAIIGEHDVFAPAAIPEVVFSDPEVISVGVTPDEASRRGLATHRFPHSASARAITHGASDGLTLVVCDAEQTVLGVHIVGPHASELAGEAALAIEMAATIEDLSLTIHPHPTMSETIAEAAWVARGSPLHIRR